ncbi:MAG: hypothetical protein IIU88_01000 [Clostridia bacterium]|nr:hypothetical protein [Clostridia bacterium]MBQ5772669.1 hypothetical protein [Clostridia bacterium]
MQRSRRKEGADGPWITWVDLLLLAAAFFVIGGSLLSLFRGETLREREEPIQYELRLCGVRRDLIEAGGLPKVGERVRTANGATDLGRVLSVSVEPHLEAISGVGIAERAGMVDLRVTVIASARKREGDGWRTGDVRIAAGMRGDFRIGAYLSNRAVVLSVRGVEE